MGLHIKLPFQAFLSGQSIPLFGLMANKKDINVIIFIYINMLNISWHKNLMQNRYVRALFDCLKPRSRAVCPGAIMFILVFRNLNFKGAINFFAIINQSLKCL